MKVTLHRLATLDGNFPSHQVAHAFDDSTLTLIASLALWTAVSVGSINQDPAYGGIVRYAASP